MERRLSFEEILEREEYVLVDTSISIQDERGSDWYSEMVYPANSYSEIDEGALRERISDLDSFISLLRNSHVYTSSGVSFKLGKIRDLVGEKRRYLECPPPKRSKRRRNGNRSSDEVSREPQRRLLEEVQELFHKSYLHAKKYVLEPTKKDLYDYLERLVLGVTKITGLKKDFAFGNEGYLGTNRGDFHTDEQIFSLALYLSLRGNESCILTKDSDFRRILMNVLGYISDPNISHPRNNLLESLGKNGIRIYHTSYGEGKLELDTSEIGSVSRLHPRDVERINRTLEN